jgi:hypothetical protein
VTPIGEERQPAYWDSFVRERNPDDIFVTADRKFNAGIAGLTASGLGLLVPVYQDGCKQAQRLVLRIDISRK